MRCTVRYLPWNSRISSVKGGIKLKLHSCKEYACLYSGYRVLSYKLNITIALPVLMFKIREQGAGYVGERTSYIRKEILMRWRDDDEVARLVSGHLKQSEMCDQSEAHNEWMARQGAICRWRGPTIGEGGDTTISSPGRSPKQPLPAMRLHDPLHSGQTSPEFIAFDQGVGQICLR